MSELEEAHDDWVRRKKELLGKLEDYAIGLDVVAITSKIKSEQKFYYGVKRAIIEAIKFIKEGEI